MREREREPRESEGERESPGEKDIHGVSGPGKVTLGEIRLGWCRYKAHPLAIYPHLLTTMSIQSTHHLSLSLAVPGKTTPPFVGQETRASNHSPAKTKGDTCRSEGRREGVKGKVWKDEGQNGGRRH